MTRVAGIFDVNRTYLSFTRVAVFTIAAALASSASAAFNVRPMMMAWDVQAGRRSMQLVHVSNPSPDTSMRVKLEVCDLSQSRGGTWLIIEDANDIPADFDVEKMRSCKDWIKFNKDAVDIPPLGSIPILVTMTVPPRLRGFYSAGILATEILPDDIPGVGLAVRYMIPVLTTIQGRAAAAKVTLTDLSMRVVPASLEGPATTILSLHVENTGDSYASIDGRIKLQMNTQGHWWTVTEQEYDNLGIFPGLNLVLDKDIQRALPSGQYRLIGGIFVDGRRTRAIGKDVQFVGDPTVTRAAIDMKLGLEPEDLIIDGTPGYARSGTYQVTNPSGDTLNVRTSLSVPRVLSGSIGNARGTELACVQWLTVFPEEFTLRARGTRTVRVTAEMPKVEDAAQLHPNYYAQLDFSSSYEDGLSAGTTNANVSVANTSVKAVPTAVAMAVTPRLHEESTYIIVGGFVNSGSVHFTPKCTAGLFTATGGQVVLKLLNGKTTIMLPYESRTFSALFDLNSVPEGNYRLSASMEYGGAGPATKDVPVRVSEVDGNKVLTIIDRIEFEKQTGAKWN